MILPIHTSNILYAVLLTNTCSVFVFFTLHYDIHLMPSVSCSKHRDSLFSLQGLKLKVPLVTSIYSGGLLKTVFNLFWCLEYPFSGSRFCTLLPRELPAHEPGFKSLNDLSVLNNSWAWSGSQQNRQLSVIPRLHQSIWGALWIAALPTTYTRLWAGPLSLASPQWFSFTIKYAREIWLYAMPLRGPPRPLPWRRRRTKVLHLSRFRLPPSHHLCEGAVVLGEH